MRRAARCLIFPRRRLGIDRIWTPVAHTERIEDRVAPDDSTAKLDLGLVCSESAFVGVPVDAEPAIAFLSKGLNGSNGPLSRALTGLYVTLGAIGPRRCSNVERALGRGVDGEVCCERGVERASARPGRNVLPMGRSSLEGVLVVGTDGLFTHAAPEDVAAITRANPSRLCRGAALGAGKALVWSTAG